MGCGCSGKTQAPRSGRPAVRGVPAGRTRVFFFVRPPAGVDEPEERFTTIYAARSFVKSHKGWVLESRRVEVDA